MASGSPLRPLPWRVVLSVPRSLCRSVGIGLRPRISLSRLPAAPPRSRGRDTVALEHRLLTGEVLPAPDCDIDVGRAQLDGVASAAGHLRRDDRGAGAGEGLVDRLTRRGVVL